MGIRDKNCRQLQEIIKTQQKQIEVLSERVLELENSDIGNLRQRIEDLETENEALVTRTTELEERVDNLEMLTVMSFCVSTMVGTSLIGLAIEKASEFIDKLPSLLDDAKKQKLQDELEPQEAQLVEAIIQIDILAIKAIEEESRRIQKRVKTLPRFRRIIFEGLRKISKPTQIGTKILDYLHEDPMFEKLLAIPYVEDRIKVVGALLDTGSSVWPLVATNAFVPLMRYLGLDEASESAGEILDALDRSEQIPRYLISKVRHDLIEMGAVTKRAKADTIIEYLSDGHELQKLGLSPDQAEYREIDRSASHLKRASKAYNGLVQLYDRVSEDTGNEFLEKIEAVTIQIDQAVEKFSLELETKEEQVETLDTNEVKIREDETIDVWV